MNIVVIVKRTDPAQSQDRTNAIDFYDRVAVETAVEIKEKSFMVPTTVSAICIAPVESSQVIRECFALGADDAYLLDDPQFEKVDLDGLIKVLARGIKKAGNVDLIVMGGSSKDTVLINLGKKLAENLGFKHMPNIDDLDGYDGKIFAKVRNKDKAPINYPVLVNLSTDIEYNLSKAQKIMRLFKKEVKILNARDLELV